MRRVLTVWVPVVLWMIALVASTAAAPRGDRQATGGWTIPTTAQTEKSPLTVNDKVLADGKKLYVGKCQHCHGPLGKGDGDDADPMHKDDMNLTNGARAARNPDGVVFYKVWNGRTTPKMPAFSAELSKEQVWTVVAYVQTLRAK